jgi:hypothetical protein
MKKVSFARICKALVVGIDVMFFIIRVMNSGPYYTLIISDIPLGYFKKSSLPISRIVCNDRSDLICSTSRLKSLIMLNERNILPYGLSRSRKTQHF